MAKVGGGLSRLCWELHLVSNEAKGVNDHLPFHTLNWINHYCYCSCWQGLKTLQGDPRRGRGGAGGGGRGKGHLRCLRGQHVRWERDKPNTCALVDVVSWWTCDSQITWNTRNKVRRRKTGGAGEGDRCEGDKGKGGGPGGQVVWQVRLWYGWGYLHTSVCI